MLKERLLERLSPEALDAQIRDKQEAFCGLLTEDAAVRVLAHEAGIPDVPRLFVPVPLSSAAPGVPISVVVRLMHVFAEKRFQTGSRNGRLQKARVADASGEAELVLWNQDADFFSTVRRGDVLALRDVVPKTLSPLELHGRLSSEISKSENGDGLPQAATPRVKLNALAAGEFDCACRIVEKQPLKAFERNGRKGYLCKIAVSDGSAVVPVACWDQNAHAADALAVGAPLLLEGASQKGGEIHAGWSARILVGDEQAGFSAASVYPEKTLADLDGNAAKVAVTVQKVVDAKRSFMCPSCGTKNGSSECGCGQTGLPAKTFVTMEVFDASAQMRAVLFDEAALSFLGAKADTDLALLFPLKRDYLAGTSLNLLAYAKNGPGGEKEVVGKAVLA
ncbi:MAG: hypothetical protein Q8P02_03945 [Candidatus Micrarchaeota archaeon]|nr:hypothetical protein [Candidatus Micrarchaeota archaeon]